MGGALVVAYGYQSAFIATIVAIAVALVIVVLKVDEPRRRRAL